ncbi:ATP-dependent Clp protease adaptor protein ClpS [Yoonia tamlensis]|uniref:ATP-dependent Clp protease adapter protein ClpS n=2 Tax=Yoonia tamlensis TaxID=390270 RepID=A0A1I6GS87_9RHOB|nr:ATP-dependent Clp protease adaptor protein ClpS [Yoonia tamlensis]
MRHIEIFTGGFPRALGGLYMGLTKQGDAMLADFYMMADKPDDGDDSDFGVALETKPKTKRPPMYKVMILNDDFTPMEFVVQVLERFFGLSHAQSFEIMLTVHKKGIAVVGVFSHEIAETKVAQVMDFAQRHQHPLQCTMEKE